MKKNILALGAVLTLVSACTHDRVEVSKVSDAQMSCAQINQEITDVKIARGDIKGKTGFSGRNVAMGLLFWPGVVVNEVNGNKADSAALQRIDRLVALSDQKGCAKQFDNNSSTEEVVETPAKMESKSMDMNS